MKKLLTMPIFFLLFVLAACSGSEGNSAGIDANSETTANSAITEASEPETTGERAETTESFALPGRNIFPEGVAYDAASGDFYVSNSEDGTIYRSNVTEGPEEAEVFLEGRTDGRSIVFGMKVDEQGRLFAAGGSTGRAFVYDTATGDLIKAFDTNPNGQTLMNDVTVTQDAAYFTDSFRPTLFRVSLTDENVGEIEPWLDLSGTPIEYGEGNNLDGIAATPDGRYLIVAQPTTRNLYRIDTNTEQVTQIDLGGEDISAVNGIWLEDQNLYAASDETDEIFPVELSEDFTSGTVGEPFTDPSLEFPTTIAKHDEGLLVVNHQVEGEPVELPYTVSNISVPE